MSDPSQLSRRGFLGGASVTAATSALLDSAAAHAASGAEPVSGATPITLTLNGAKKTLTVEPRTTLAAALRDSLGLTGTKVVCDRGACSACTVHVDGTPMLGCTLLAIELEGRKIVTIEGLAKGDALHPVQQAFIEQDAMQCGFCTPGMVMSCAGLLTKNKKPTEADARDAIAGNLCRCGTYPKVVAAVLQASGQKPPPTLELASTALAPDGQGRLLGVVGTSLSRGEAPPAGEPQAWGTNAQLRLVGKPTPRIDGRQKVTGAARYTADVRLPGMLYARRVVSVHPHAKVKSIDTSAAEALPGVKAVHVVERTLEGAKLRDPSQVKGERYPTIRYAGQAVAAVAATTPELADQAARLVKVEYEPLPFTVDLEEARGASAPLVFPGPTEQPPTAGGGGAPKGLPQKGNVRGPDVKSRGDVKKGLAEAKLKLSGDYRTQVQTHTPLEAHGVVADWRDDGLTVYVSTQSTASARNELATVFELDAGKVRIISEFMGGGFGAKFGAGTYGVLATHLSRAAKAPVRLVLDREEEHVSAGNRPATVQHLELGATENGTLTALSVQSYGTGGVSTGSGAGFFAERLYATPNFRSEHSDVFTHAGPAAAFRAPGNVQGAFALEQLIDELAEKLGVDPLELRERLDVGEDPRDPQREARRLERKLGAERFGWARRKAPGSDGAVVKRGVGVAQSLWGRFVDMDSSCDVRINRDGSVELLSSVMDIGTGTRTALALVVAEELGLASAADVTLRIGDTHHPVGPSSGGSKTLVGVASVARNAAADARQQFLAEVAGGFGVPATALELVNGEVRKQGEPKGKPFKKVAAGMKREQLTAHAQRKDDYGGNPKSGYGGVQFAEVSVDTETGVVKVERVVAVHDCGRPLNPLAVQSQVNGGVIHGISFALFEERRLDPRSGRMLNANLDQYKVLGSRDTPHIETVLLEHYQGLTSVDANGIGEPANIATAAAVANAVYNAVGVRLRELPMTPRAVLTALKGARS
ncbi:MAG: molybdopterin-dependent oxidoreductase [Archangiaceae bacterium]|nr:molybdopterin-dependent oxidoreductase [Archangiaceae bacterium]